MNDNYERSNFITNIREMSTSEKVILGFECFCYVAAAATLVIMGVEIAGEQYDSLLKLGLSTASIVISSQAARICRKNL